MLFRGQLSPNTNWTSRLRQTMEPLLRKTLALLYWDPARAIIMHNCINGNANALLWKSTCELSSIARNDIVSVQNAESFKLFISHCKRDYPPTLCRLQSRNVPLLCDGIGRKTKFKILYNLHCINFPLYVVGAASTPYKMMSSERWKRPAYDYRKILHYIVTLRYTIVSQFFSDANRFAMQQIRTLCICRISGWNIVVRWCPLGPRRH